MKKLLFPIVAALGLLFTVSSVNAQSAGRLTAWTKPNPGNPLVVTSFSCSQLDGGLLLLDFTVRGQGWFRCVEVCTGNQMRTVCEWVRSGGTDTEYVYVVDAADYLGCFFDLENIHGWGGAAL